MQAELTAAKKESAFYLRKVEQAKAIDAMEERKRKRAGAEHADAAAGGPAAATAAAGGQKKRRRAEEAPAPSLPAADADAAVNSVRRKFKQRRVAKDPMLGHARSDVLGSLLATRKDG